MSEAVEPFVTAYVTWACEFLAAALLNGSWDATDAAEASMRDAYCAFLAACVPAGSGAATELDYYGGAWAAAAIEALELREETLALNEYAAANGETPEIQRRWVSSWTSGSDT